MPWLQLYTDKADLAQLVAWLDAEEVIAFIVPDGPRRWRAVPQLGGPLPDGQICLGHTQSGPLPLLHRWLASIPFVPGGKVRDPFAGWRERRTGADPTVPYFGEHPGVYWFRAHTSGKGHQGEIGISAFDWTGNRYRPLGDAAPPVAARWWERFRRYVRKHAVYIPSSGPIDGPDPWVWAMPSALARIRQGCERPESWTDR